MLTGIPFKKGVDGVCEGKYLYVINKNLPVEKGNVMMTGDIVTISSATIPFFSCYFSWFSGIS